MAKYIGQPPYHWRNKPRAIKPEIEIWKSSFNYGKIKIILSKIRNHPHQCKLIPAGHSIFNRSNAHVTVKHILVEHPKYFALMHGKYCNNPSMIITMLEETWIFYQYK